MTNFTAKILNNSVSALNAQQAVIATSANNIANVNTPGYSRRMVSLETRTSGGAAVGLDIGNGVQVSDIVRIGDQFIDKMLNEATGDKGSATARNDLLDKVQRLFNLTGEQSGIGQTLVKFFSAADDLAVNPSSIELRTNFLSNAQNLVDSIRSTYNSIASLQSEADKRVASEVSVVNNLLTQIAKLNSTVSAREAVGGTAADDRDQRQVLLNKLAEKINFSSFEQTNGSITISLPNGFSLVNEENARLLTVTSSPSFGGALPPSLAGQSLSYITYDFSGGAGGQQLDLTQQITSGSIGGLLALRGYADPSNT
ncbi:MAG: flagellar hook-associated protein FlgK, partial [Proteobacteria bacterium]|nr:flagellar hook-associated protein FlgK [Pseudomonadota bacterium]